MYIRFSNKGEITDYSKEILSFFRLNSEDIHQLNYFDLIGRNIGINVTRRFFRKVLPNIGQEMVISFKFNSIISWTEWVFHEGSKNEVIAIGKDITCIKKFEPIIKGQNNKLRLQNKNMIDSLVYAKQIQNALLPSIDLISAFKDTFVVYRPKDVVSGDFYWFYKEDSKVYIISIDCTGHGVPGALMTVLVNALLNEIIKLDEVRLPHQVLTLLDSKLAQALQANGKVINDGLDIAVGLYDFKTKILSFSGALQNIQVLKGDKLYKLKGERYPIGHFPYCRKNFTTSDYQLDGGDRFYLYSDGMTDQFGGGANKKIGAKQFNSLLKNTGKLTMMKQKKAIMNFYNKWKGENEQIDDVLLMGFEV